MTNSTKILSGSLQAAFAAMAIGVFCAGAHAADLNQITVQGSTVKTVGRDAATGAPIEDITERAAVSYDPATLTTDSGVKLLKAKVADAARQACDSADPLGDDDGTCVPGAIRSAQDQIARVVAQARGNTSG